MYFVGNLDFSGGFNSLRFAIEVGSMEALSALIYPLWCLKSVMNSSLCKWNVQIVSYNNSFILSDIYCSCKERKSEMSFRSSMRSKLPHFWNCNFSCLEAKKVRNKSNQKMTYFSDQESESTMSMVAEIKIHMIWKYIFIQPN